MTTSTLPYVKQTAPALIPLSLLLAEDSEDDALLLIRFLRENGYDPHSLRIYTRTACEDAIRGQTFDVIIADYSMPQFTALHVIRMLKDRNIDTPIIVVSGTMGEDAAVETMRAGASDYVMKGNLRRLIPALERELREAGIRKAHARAKKVNLLLSTAFEQASETVVITDTRGIIEYANPAFETISGYTREEALGKPISILKSGKQDAGFYRELWQTLSSGRVWRGRFKNKRKNGSLYEEDVAISPVRDSSGQITNYVAVKHDITREMELQQQLSQAQKLKAIGQFAHKVAHDFTNVLMMILGNAEMAKKQLPESSEALPFIAEITRAANRITSFVAQLMAFAHSSPPRTTTIRLDRIIGGIEEIIRKATYPAITLDINIRNPQARVKADTSLVEQAIIHMVDNAIDAMPGVGTLTLEVSSTDVSREDALSLPAHLRDDAGQQRDYAILTLKDTGHGMTEEVQARMFEPFFTTKKNKHNIGLGLAMVYKTVEQHQGHITVESVPGQGSTFRIFLPLVPPNPQPAPPDLPRQGEGG